ncbi:MAG: alpha-1,4-glucan--maltose-1-phosphate maltosyltransferase [Spirochaetales bacterium]|nr:alpha-1,4-glucan--maltose-1-phosphate maltosyltransferase [Spirochaetales bacterium]
MKSVSRVVIERVSPLVDGGRFPARRIVGETVTVSADIFTEGQGEVRGYLLYRPETRKSWSRAALSLEGKDRWRGDFAVPATGRYLYTIEAWVSGFLTWRTGYEKKFRYNSNERIDLESGKALLEELLENRPAARLRRRLEAVKAAATLREKSLLILDEGLAHEAALIPDRRSLVRWETEAAVVALRERAGCGAWYEFFPRSAGADGKPGAFRDAEKKLIDIAGLGFDVVYFPPIHPIGRTNRKGRNNSIRASSADPGSPWAIGNESGGHTAVDPALGAIGDFTALVRAAGKLGLEVALDIAFQCSPDHPWVREHPDWFKRRPDGSVQYAENPPKKYEDIYPLDFNTADRKGLWEELKNVFLFWVDKGVRIFRVDNPHTKPFDFWEWCLREVTAAHPDVIFLAEAFTRPAVMRYLAKIGFTQSYTYFTWRTGASEIREYLTELTRSGMRDYFNPNFWPNTPDILPLHLHNAPRQAFIIRLVLAATLSANYGIYGPAFELCVSTPLPGREEYLDSEKFEYKRWEDRAPGNIREVVRRINRIRREHPALRRTMNLEFCESDNDALLAYCKTDRESGDVILCVVNLNPRVTENGFIRFQPEKAGLPDDRPYQALDLITGDRYVWHNDWHYVSIDPFVMPAHILSMGGK